MFGLQAAGDKRVQIEQQEDIFAAATQGLKELETAFKNNEVSEEQYKSVKLELLKLQMDNEMSSVQKWGLITSAGLIEGGVTRFFGTIPNANKVWKNWFNPIDDAMGAITRSNTRAVFSALGNTILRTTGEIVEEELIFLGTMASESAWLGKDFDISGWDDVFVSSIIVGGSMNGPGIAYSTMMQQMVTAPMRQRYFDLKADLADFDIQLEDLDINDPNYELKYRSIKTQKEDVWNQMIEMNDEMELMAMTLGAENMNDLINAGYYINELNKVNNEE